MKALKMFVPTITIILVLAGCSSPPAATLPSQQIAPAVQEAPEAEVPAAEPSVPAKKPTEKSKSPEPVEKPKKSAPVKVVVYGTRTGKKYHRSNCRSLSRSKIAMSLSDASGLGLAPCNVCNPPR